MGSSVTGNAGARLAGIYAAAFEPDRWPDILGNTGIDVGASSAFFFSAHSDADRNSVAHVHNHAPELVRDFFGHWHRHDAWAQQAPLKGVRAGHIVRGSTLVDPGELRRTAYFNDFLRHHGIERMVGAVLFDGTEADRVPFTHICWYRPPGAADFEGRDAERLQRLLPHFQRAMRVHRRLSWLPSSTDSPALDALYVASLLLDGRGVIQHCNTPAQGLLASLPVGSVRFGRLRSIGLRCTPSVDEALAACQPARPVRLTAYLGGSRPQVVSATMLDIAQAPLGRSGADGGPRFLLLVELPRATSGQAAEAVAPLFGLTPAETRVLEGLLQGLPPAGIAQACGSAVATVRTQISSILVKTGTRGQTDLLLLLRALRF